MFRSVLVRTPWWFKIPEKLPQSAFEIRICVKVVEVLDSGYPGVIAPQMLVASSALKITIILCSWGPESSSPAKQN